MPADTKLIDLAGLRAAVEALQPWPFEWTPEHMNERHYSDIAEDVPALLDRVEALEAGLREALRPLTHDLNCAHMRGVFGPFVRGQQGPCDCRIARLRSLLPPEAPRAGEGE